MCNENVAAAVFVSLSSDIGIANPSVFRFTTKDEAEEFVFQKLVELKERAVNPDGSIWSGDRQERFESRSDAIESWQEGLGGSEYFHVYECHDAASIKIHQP